MSYKYPEIIKAREAALNIIKTDEPANALKSSVLKDLYKMIPLRDQDSRADFGREVNDLKNEIQQLINESQDSRDVLARDPIDVTAPFADNSSYQDVQVLPASKGTIHPITGELDRVLGIFESMGFEAVESVQLDDDYHMFGSLNFPEGHPARDDWDTFVTEDNLIAPAHTSTMQNRVIKDRLDLLKNGQNIQVVIPGRCFRNEDVDARHEHTLHQVEGVMVGEGINAGNLIATLRSFLESFYGKKLDVKTQPAYFPFTEPSFEFALSCPFCDKKGCRVCSNEGWIELLGCGMIHPNVLKEAGVDSTKYTGFAWGFGLDRLVMMQYNIDDIRWFHSGRLEFLEQF